MARMLLHRDEHEIEESFICVHEEVSELTERKAHMIIQNMDKLPDPAPLELSDFIPKRFI
jgi:hypothetical protein